MQQAFTPQIAPSIMAMRPDYRALSITARNMVNVVGQAQGSRTPFGATRDFGTEYAQAHIQSWREAYRAFGVKPQRTLCSVEALLKRLEKQGELPSINPIVDLYNQISIRYALPIGGEDIDAYFGQPRLVIAQGDEPFETNKEGSPCIDTATTGEVIWRDDHGVTCRNWNWRQCTRTQITPATTNAWFVLERLEPMPMEALHEAGAALIEGLKVITSEVWIEQQLVSG